MNKKIEVKEIIQFTEKFKPDTFDYDLLQINKDKEYLIELYRVRSEEKERLLSIEKELDKKINDAMIILGLKGKKDGKSRK